MNTCETVRTQLDAYLDGELLAPAKASVDSHLASCEACRKTLETRKAISASVRSSVHYVTAPTSLGAQFLKRPKVPMWRSRPILFGVAGVALALGGLGLWKMSASPVDRTVNELIDAYHAPSTVMDHTTQDPNAMRAWFRTQGVKYCPAISDLNDLGFDLVGGKISHAGGQKIATLRYRYQNRTIDLSITPFDVGIDEKLDRKGTFVRTWSDCNVEYWAVSDSHPEDLDNIHFQFVERRR